jgi:mono/diheme cytochrome c family protein
MGKKILKWSLITIGSLIAIVLIFYAVVYFKTEARINKVYGVKPQKLIIPQDSSAYIRGRHIAEIRGCLGCHGGNLAAGRAFLDEKSPVGVLYAANITSGKGGIQFTDEDWIRVLRHGLDKENKSLWFMPSHEVYHISNQEMSDLICFLKQQPPVDKTVPAKTIKPLGRLLTFFNQFPLLPAEMIDHNATYQNTVQAATTAAYGGYLATTCMGCHGPNFKGAPAHGENEPPIPDISATGHLGKWESSQFITALRNGKTPEGKQLSDAMPWKEFTYTDDELKAIYLYLHQVK